MVVTIGHYYGHELPALTRDDFTITQFYDPLEITSLTPLRGDRAGLELFILVDNCSNFEPGPKFEELRRFIAAQPSTTAVGIAYIEGGRLFVAENPTQDHGRAVQALRAPSGGKPSSPFDALTELVQGWRQGSPRRAVLMISNGINPGAANSLEDPSAAAAIEAAERAGVIVYTLYHPSADYLGADSSAIASGQLPLAYVAVETGGEAYFTGFGPLPSLAPFLADLADHLANQYLVEFLVTPAGGSSGELRRVMIESKIPYTDLMAPFEVWVADHAATPHSGKGQELHGSRGSHP